MMRIIKLQCFVLLFLFLNKNRIIIIEGFSIRPLSTSTSTTTTTTPTTPQRHHKQQQQQQQQKQKKKAAFMKRTTTTMSSSSSSLFMSFYSDASDYASSKSDFDMESDTSRPSSSTTGDYNDDNLSTTTIKTKEHNPVPKSKNSGNRFVAIIFDRNFQNKEENGESLDVWKMHNERTSLTEEHVLFCRKTNLYNETFNQDSMVDILYSHQMLSSDLQRAIGHIFIMESTKLEYIHDLLSREPIVQKLLSNNGNNSDISQIPLFRWRHIRDHTLRIDDGRNGLPHVLIQMDRTNEESNVGNVDMKELRSKWNQTQLEYWIRSERVIAAGPLYLPTKHKQQQQPKSSSKSSSDNDDNDDHHHAVGDLILFNAPNRIEAINFAEENPMAKEHGLFKSMHVHQYNRLDVTGKFISSNLVDDSWNVNDMEMREALEYWGYPVDDEQTPWLNW